MDNDVNYCPNCGKLAVGAQPNQSQKNEQTNGQNEQNDLYRTVNPQYQNQYQSYNYSGYKAPVNIGYSTLGIVAFILSLTVSGIAGLICGIIDLSVHKENKHGLSVAAIIISIVKILFSIIAIVFYVILLMSSSAPLDYSITVPYM